MDGGAWWTTYSPRGRKESDTTERLHFHFHRHFQGTQGLKINLFYLGVQLNLATLCVRRAELPSGSDMLPLRGCGFSSTDQISINLLPFAAKEKEPICKFSRDLMKVIATTLLSASCSEQNQNN